jgi:hypothetical protein
MKKRTSSPRSGRARRWICSHCGDRVLARSVPAHECSWPAVPRAETMSGRPFRGPATRTGAEAAPERSEPRRR